MNQIFALAIAKGMTENNPASNLLAIAEKAPPENQYPHLLEEELPDFLKALRESESGVIVKTAAYGVAARDGTLGGMGGVRLG